MAAASPSVVIVTNWPMPASAKLQRAEPYGVLTGSSESRMGAWYSEGRKHRLKGMPGEPSNDFRLSMMLLSNSRLQEWRYGMASIGKDAVGVRGQLWGQVSQVNFLYAIKSKCYIEYSVVLASCVPAAHQAKPLFMMPPDKPLQCFASCYTPRLRVPPVLVSVIRD